MEDKYNNKGVITLLVVLVMVLSVFCILFVTGTISFNLNKANDDNVNNDGIDSEIDTNCSDIIDQIVGTYEYKGEYVDNDANIGDDFTEEQTTYDKLTLNSSGDALASAGNVRGGGYSAEGKWYISNDELIVVNNQCKATVIDGEVEYPNCDPMWIYTYKIENGKIVLTSNNNSMITVNLNKVK